MINSTYLMKYTGSGLILLIAILLSGCSILAPANISPSSKYSFDSVAATGQVSQKLAVENIKKAYAPTIVVSVPRAAAGFDNQHIVYLRQAHKLEYFQQSEWIETPAAMLAPLVSSALERSARFSAVVQSPTSAMAQLRLDLEIVRLQQEFFSVPSQVRFTLRAHLIDTASRQVIAWHEFDTSVTSTSDAPYGGVLAANIAVRIVMEELARFCVQTADEQLATRKKE
jgi:cholesterol transport system auxiliary component